MPQRQSARDFLDATERRTWFLFEASRDPDASGH
jgi:hypothetical protein